MMRLFKALGPVGFLLVGISAALIVARLTGSRGVSLGLHALIAVPSSFFGLFIHDMMDNTLGLGNMESTLLIIACTTGVIAGGLNVIWLQRKD